MENRIIDEAELARWVKIRELKALIKFSIDVSICAYDARVLYLKEKLPNLGSIHSWVQWSGHDRRHLLLSYGFLRGKKYKAIEGKTGENNSPKINLILAIVNEYSNIRVDEPSITYWLNDDATE